MVVVNFFPSYRSYCKVRRTAPSYIISTVSYGESDVPCTVCTFSVLSPPIMHQHQRIILMGFRELFVGRDATENNITSALMWIPFHKKQVRTYRDWAGLS
jgi:hypothetical protein